MSLITSRSSRRGEVIFSVACVCVSAPDRLNRWTLNRWTYGPKIWHTGQGSRSKAARVKIVR